MWPDLAEKFSVGPVILEEFAALARNAPVDPSVFAARKDEIWAFGIHGDALAFHRR